MIIIKWAIFRKRLHLGIAVVVIVGIGNVRFCQLCTSPVLTTLCNLCQPQNYLEGSIIYFILQMRQKSEKIE